MFLSLAGLVLFSCIVVEPSAPAPAPPAAPQVASVATLPSSFEKRQATDRFGRTITFYLRAPLDGTGDLPIVLFVGGSGAQSVWQQIKDKAVLSYGASVLAGEARGKARLMMVEKPGVEFLGAGERPGSAMGASAEFRTEHTLERWAEANRAALDAALKLPGIDASRILVCGHSEGGLVACRVAALEPRVTNVASAAGGGASQLFDLMLLARSGEFCQGGTGEECVQNLLNGWRDVLQDPQSADKLWLGHPYRRWSSFLASSPMEELDQTKAKIYIAQGTADRAVSVSSFDVLYAHLLSRGRDVTGKRIEGADHSFNRKNDDGSQVDGWTELWKDVIAWYVAKDAQQPAPG